MDELSYWLDNSPDLDLSQRGISETEESAAKGPPQHFASSNKFCLEVLPGRYRAQHRRVSPITGQVHELRSLAGEAARGLAGDVRACGTDLVELASVRLPKVSQPVLVATSITVALSVATLSSAMGKTAESDEPTQLAADRSIEQSASRSGEVVLSPAVGESTTSTVPATTTTSSTTAAPTTTTGTPQPRPVDTRPADTGATGGDVWQRLAKCEAGGRNDTGAPYYGYFQFSARTWASVGGTGLPNDHSYETQKALAIKLQARSGWGQWPACSSKLGLR